MAPPLGQQVEHLWAWFLELHNSRSIAGMSGEDRITYRDIYAWAQLTGREPTAWEVGVLRAMDDEYLIHMAKEREKGESNA